VQEVGGRERLCGRRRRFRDLQRGLDGGRQVQTTGNRQKAFGMNQCLSQDADDSG
jgi:hypothetical protein